MSKNDYGNSYIDFFNLTTDQADKLRGGSKVIAEYLGEIDNIRESIKDTLEDLNSDLDSDKESAVKVKKYVNKIAATIHKDKADELKNENNELETVMNKLGV